jgi:catechol 2,3-dioxygenase-like lactoylglutathione lyase family enzyme
MTITGFDHYTIRCADLNASIQFYTDVIGLRIEDRPGMPVPAAIAYIDSIDMMLIHLFQSSPDLEATFAQLNAPDGWATGRLHHVALQAAGLDDTRTHLEERQVAFVERRLERAGKHLLVFKDPDGVEIELAFPIDQAHQ